MASTRSCFHSFSGLAWVNLAAQSAEQLSLAAVPMVAVLMLGAGPGTTGLLATVQTLPFLLLAIPLGLLADRRSRAKLMVFAELLRMVSLLLLLGAVLWGYLSIGWLAVLGFVGAVGTVGFSVAAPALLPALVPSHALAHANGRLELARSAAFVAGPAVGGALVAWASASAAFGLAVALSGIAVVLLWRLEEPPRRLPAMRHPMRELQDGAGLVWHDSLLRPILLTALGWNISWFVLQAAYVPYALQQLGIGASGVGVTLGANGAGMALGALLAARVTLVLPAGRALQMGPVLSVLAALLMVVTLYIPSGVLAGLALFLFGVGAMVWSITSVTLRQMVVPAAMLGRVSAIFLTVNTGARPLGAALGAWVGAYWGASACLVLALVGFGVQAGVILGSQVRRLQQLPVG